MNIFTKYTNKKQIKIKININKYNKIKIWYKYDKKISQIEGIITKIKNNYINTKIHVYDKKYKYTTNAYLYNKNIIKIKILR